MEGAGTKHMLSEPQRVTTFKRIGDVKTGFVNAAVLHVQEAEDSVKSVQHLGSIAESLGAHVSSVSQRCNYGKRPMLRGHSSRAAAKASFSRTWRS